MAGTAESITRLATATAATALAVLAVLSLLLAAVARWRGRRAAARGFRHAAAHPARPQVCVLVLGDIGRSPRMEFHSLSLAEAGCEVQVVAYAASPAMAQFAGNEHIHVRPIRPAPALPAGVFPAAPSTAHVRVLRNMSISYLVFCFCSRPAKGSVPALCARQGAAPGVCVRRRVGGEDA